MLLLLSRKENPNLDSARISNILRLSGYVKSSRSVSRAVASLKRKKFLDNSNRLTKEGIEFVKSNELDKVKVDRDGIKLDAIEYSIRLGAKEKKLLYILSRIDRGALQLLTLISGERSKNTSLALSRLEEKGLVYGYINKIMFTNSRGIRYRPKYYGITDLGRMVIRNSHYESKEKEQIEASLKQTLELR